MVTTVSSPGEPVVRVRRHRRGPTPAQMIVLSFGAAIAAGAVLLWLPIAHAPNANIGVIEALFTATSAVCVTG